MCKEESSKIQQQMLDAVECYFINKEIKMHLSQFIKVKVQGGFPFGNLTTLHYQMFGGTHEDIYKAAAAIELMILALDIFDDLQDEDNFSMPWKKIPSAISMNISTGLLVLSTLSLDGLSFRTSNKANAIRYLNSLVLKAVDGQHIDLSNVVRTEQEYLNMTLTKSGSLVSSACLVGAALATSKRLCHDIVRKYSGRIGISVQIRNDIKDILKLDDKSDLIRKKKTLPILYLLFNPKPEFNVFREYYKGKVGTEFLLNNKANLEESIKESGALEYARVIARMTQLQAIEEIDKLDVAEEYRQKLLTYL